MTNAAAVSRVLRKAGFNPVERYKREGVSVANSYTDGWVRVLVDIDAPRRCMVMVLDVVDALVEAGYTVFSSRITGNDTSFVNGGVATQFYVLKD